MKYWNLDLMMNICEELEDEELLLCIKMHIFYKKKKSLQQ